MSKDFKLKLPRRPRRLRRTPAIRKMVAETVLQPADLIQPLFVIEGNGPPRAIESLPGQFRFGFDALVRECAELAEMGIPAVALFPCLEESLKDEMGTEALKDNTLVLRAVRAVKEKVPELAVITDIALDPYTSHGHDGVFNHAGTDLANDRTVEILRRMAVLSAAARADFVAPSDMMDGRAGAIREALDESGFTETGILAYSAKYASAYYGPFRAAIGSAPSPQTSLRGKRTYQMDPANRREALTEARLDAEEGADILMVKPAGPYLDIIREVRDASDLPVAAYQVSGEYAQIHAAARLDWLDLEQTRDEAVLAIKRAGADLILTYFAKELARAMLKGHDRAG